MGSGVIAPPFLTLALDEWSASRPVRFTHKERAPDTLCVGGRVGCTAGLGYAEKRTFLIPTGIRTPAISPSLYALSYAGEEVPYLRQSSTL
jgi:hypothetical protein